MKPGEIVEAPVVKLGAQGDGIAELRGRPIYVPLTLAGETIKVRIGRTIGEGYQGELVEIVKPSAARIAPACPHFSECGGCSLQHLGAHEYAIFKKGIVQGALRQHKLDDTLVRDPIITPAHTRRRITVTALSSKNGVIIGFNARASAHVVDIATCPVARPELMAVLPALRKALAPWLAKAKMLDLTLTATDTGLDILITGPEADLAGREAISALNSVSSIARISWRKSERSSSEPMLAKHTPMVSFGATQVPLPPGAFLQASHEGEVALTGQVMAALGHPQGKIADLFAGLGTFSIPLSLRGEVLAVESDEALLKTLAGLKVSTIKTDVRDLFRDPLTAKELADFAALVFDPPRAGAQAQVAEIAKSKVPLVIAVSCNPGTFARDAQALVAGGYRLEWVQPVDQFLWSGHVELVARFSR